MNQESSKIENILRAAEGFGSSGLSFLIGLGLWGAIAVAGFLCLIFLVLNDGYIYSKETCVKLQQIEGKIYKINSCLDTVTEVGASK